MCMSDRNDLDRLATDVSRLIAERLEELGIPKSRIVETAVAVDTTIRQAA